MSLLAAPLPAVWMAALALAAPLDTIPPAQAAPVAAALGSGSGPSLRHDQGLALLALELQTLEPMRAALEKMDSVARLVTGGGLTALEMQRADAVFRSLVVEFDDLAESTALAGIHPFDGSLQRVLLQVAPGGTQLAWTALWDLRAETLGLDQLTISSVPDAFAARIGILVAEFELRWVESRVSASLRQLGGGA